jgi:hypothetical protein
MLNKMLAAALCLFCLVPAGCAKKVKLGPVTGDVSVTSSAAGAFVVKDANGKVVAAVNADVDAETAAALLGVILKAKLAGKLSDDQAVYVDALIALLQVQAAKLEK